MALQHPPAPVSQPPAHGFLPKVATGLTDQDRRRIEDALDHSVSANTRTMYASAWNSFDEWTQARGVPSLPAPPELVAAYLLELAEEREVSVATIRLHKAAITAIHCSTGHEGVKRVMGGIARSSGRAQRQAKPLTAEALAAVRATASSRRPLGGAGKRHQSQNKAERRGRVDLAILSVLRDGLLSRSEAAQLRWSDVEFRDNGAALLHIPQSKTDQEAEGTVLYIGRAAAETLRAITPEGKEQEPNTPVFGLSTKQIGRRVDAAAKAAGLGDGFTGHSGRVGMAQDLAATGVELLFLMTAVLRKSPWMPARYYQESGVRERGKTAAKSPAQLSVLRRGTYRSAGPQRAPPSRSPKRFVFGSW